ncbi:MAG: HAMP domain-containing histidine kinase [Gammaproteobacteria bacterium]|nr:HAMP domain-containing histidine kinase [Gammaproteobacteria bacterium]
MRLKSSIFLWVSLATIIPLTAMILGITTYSERLYKKNVERDIYANIENIVSEIDFRLNYERQLIISLASSPAMNNFFPVLKVAADGDLHHNYFEEVEKVSDFLAGFQHSVPGLDTLRLLDVEGNTLVKVRFGKRLPPLFESMEDIPYAEEELVGKDFLGWMHKLTPYQLAYAQLPLSQRDYVSGQETSILNSIVPLADSEQQIIGFLSARSLGDQLDHILKTLPRSHNFQLSIAELNPDNKQRHGMILYSDNKQISFNQAHEPEHNFQQAIQPQQWQQLQQDRSGSFIYTDTNQHFYYREFYPYNNQLLSWVIILQLDEQDLSAPFQGIRIGILAFAFVILVISLLLANMGARHIAEPITRFATILKKYADGETQTNPQLPDTSEELRQLDQSFHYLVDTLKSAQQERDQAQSMMLQHAKLASIGEMAAGIGHELNNPLNNILSFSKLIERDLPDGNQTLRNDVIGLRNETLRASKIIKGILNFARQLPPEYTEFELLPWLDETLQLVTPEAHEHHIELLLMPSPAINIQGDRGQLQQVLVNLLINAIQASDSPAAIEIYAQQNNHTVKIIVSDEGKGIPKENRDKIFDPFFSTKNVGEGSGLGLSISLGIVQFHHGELALEPNHKGGIDAIITLPLKFGHD